MSSATIITENIANLAGRAPQSVEPENQLVADLGLDSLDMIELVMALEEEFEIDISDSEAENCATVADVIALVERKGGAA